MRRDALFEWCKELEAMEQTRRNNNVVSRLFMRQMTGNSHVYEDYTKFSISLSNSVNTKYKKMRELALDVKWAFDSTEITEQMSVLKTLDRHLNHPDATFNAEAACLFGIPDVLLRVLGQQVVKSNPTESESHHSSKQQTRFLAVLLVRHLSIHPTRSYD